MAGRDSRELTEARNEVEAAMGTEAMVDAVGVCSLFHLMTRVANGTGTPLDPMMVRLSPTVTAQFGADNYLSSHDTPV
jgi:hypothetical protein